MKKSMDRPVPIAAEGGLDDLNRWLGRREAFGLVAGRCSAADVECMRNIRDGKLYLSRAESWADFCVKDLHMGKSNANRLIGLLEKSARNTFTSRRSRGFLRRTTGPLHPLSAHGESSRTVRSFLSSLRTASGSPPRSSPCAGRLTAPQRQLPGIHCRIWKPRATACSSSSRPCPIAAAVPIPTWPARFSACGRRSIGFCRKSNEWPSGQRLARRIGLGQCLQHGPGAGGQSIGRWLRCGPAERDSPTTPERKTAAAPGR